jgi:two-component system sensor histidine kinase YesM
MSKRGNFQSTIRNIFSRFMERFFFQRSMQYQLLTTYIVINLVPILLVGIISYKVSSNSIREEVQKNNTQSIQEISRSINTFLKNLSDQANTFEAKMLNNSIAVGDKFQLDNIMQLQDIMEINDYLNSTFEASEDFLSIRVYSNSGNLISTAFNRETYKIYSYNSEEETVWQERMRSNFSQRIIFDVHPLDLNGEYSFVLSYPIINPFTNERKYYISYDVDFTRFATLFKHFEGRSGSEISIIQEDGSYLYNTNYSMIGHKADSSLMTLLKNSDQSSQTANIHGKPMIITYNALTYDNLIVLGSVPLDSLTRHLHPLQNLTVLISLVSLLLVTMLSIFFSIYITKPIKRLSILMGRVQRGNLTARIDMPKANIEIGSLSRYFNSMVETMNELIKNQYETELHRKDAEYRALLMQINPHFLYNTLEAISGIADYEGVDRISDITQSLSKMLRYNIDLKSERVRVADEVENCRNYFLIIKSRFEENLVVEMDVDPDAEGCWMIKTILQPLLENSIKHGIEKKIGQGYIGLTVKKIGEEVVLQVKDNGVGFPPEKINEFERYKRSSAVSFYDSSGDKNLGLRNVYSRLSIIFGNRMDLLIESVVGESTVITIKIPAVY